MADHQETLATFISITGADGSAATSMLEATGYDLEQAVTLYFASTGGDAAEDDEALARRLQQGGDAPPAPAAASRLPAGGEEEVRAPLPVKRDRLYDEGYLHHRPHRQPAQQVQAVDAFRDFRAETEGGAGSSAQGLAGMFAPPRDLMYDGAFEQAKEQALEKEQWLLVNIQSNSQFASHMLNRDTWGHEAVKSLIKESFLFFQAQDVSDAGSKVISFYHLYELPAVLVVDPVTGAKLRSWTGFIEPDRLLEELVPFLDHGPTDAGAHHLAASHHKRKQPDTQPAAGPSGRQHTEDEEMAMALAMSMQDTNGRTGGAAPAVHGAAPTCRGAASSSAAASAEPARASTRGSAAGREAAAAPQPPAPAPAKPSKSPEQALAEAALAVAPEPDASNPAACRVAVRLPDGSRVQRRFLRSAPLSALAAFCRSQSADAAQGRAFRILQSIPGAPELANLEESLEAAGAANSMVVMKWVEESH